MSARSRPTRGPLLLLPLLCVLLGWPAAAQAKDFSVSRQWLFAARAQDLLAVITAYGAACDHGCRYRAPHVTHELVLPYHRRPDDFYVWTFVEDVQNTTFFSHVTVRRSSNRIRVEFRLVSAKIAAALSKASGKPHDPNFDDSVTTYDLEELSKDGRFQRTRVSFHNTLRISGLAAMFGAGTVRDRLDEDARATFENLRSVPAPAPQPAREPQPAQPAQPVPAR